MALKLILHPQLPYRLHIGSKYWLPSGRALLCPFLPAVRVHCPVDMHLVILPREAVHLVMLLDKGLIAEPASLCTLVVPSLADREVLSLDFLARLERVHGEVASRFYRCDGAWGFNLSVGKIVKLCVVCLLRFRKLSYPFVFVF